MLASGSCSLVQGEGLPPHSCCPLRTSLHGRAVPATHPGPMPEPFWAPGESCLPPSLSRVFWSLTTCRHLAAALPGPAVLLGRSKQLSWMSLPPKSWECGPPLCQGQGLLSSPGAESLAEQSELECEEEAEDCPVGWSPWHLW